MAIFYASCPKGMIEALEKELQELGLQTVDRNAGGVVFEGEGC